MLAIFENIDFIGQVGRTRSNLNNARKSMPLRLG